MKYRSGDAKAICDRCGLRFYLSQLQKDHDSFMVDAKCLDGQHPQELARPAARSAAVKNARPEGVDAFLSYGDVTADDL